MSPVTLLGLYLSMVGLALAGNNNNVPVSVTPHPHDSYQVGNSPYPPPYPSTSATTPMTLALPIPPPTGEKAIEHDQLGEELMEEKKRFEQKYLDCDDELVKLVRDIEAGIREHDHDKAKRLLDQMRAYKVNEAVTDPCAGKEKVKGSGGGGGSSSQAGKVESKVKNGAASFSKCWTFVLLPLMTLVGGGR